MDVEVVPRNQDADGSEIPAEKPIRTGVGNRDSADAADTTFSVYWEEPADQDPDNPMNWTSSRKWSHIGILSVFSFLTPLASSMIAPGVPIMMAEFGTDNDQFATFVISGFVLGFAFGPLILAPMSEIYGRTVVYHVCNTLFTILTAACGLANSMGMLIAFRILAGFAGVAVVTCGAGTIADLMPPERRGKAMSLWSLGPLLGPIIGPVCSGFLVEAKGWRWVFWIITIVSAVVTAASLFILQETYTPVLLERKAERLRKETGNKNYHSRLKEEELPKELFIKAIMRPSRLFFFSPVVMCMCIYIAAIYGLLYILFTTFTPVYEEIYGFTPSGAGLSFIATGVGNLLGLGFIGFFSDRILRQKGSRGRTSLPEDRLDLHLILPTSISLPLGLITYGWTAENRVHWIAPMIGTSIMGFGMIGVFMIVQTYLVNADTPHAASVTAANAVLRSLLGALLPLCGLQLYDSLGLGWGNTLLGLIALVLAPITWVFAIFGTSPKFQKEF